MYGGFSQRPPIPFKEYVNLSDDSLLTCMGGCPGGPDCPVCQRRREFYADYPFKEDVGIFYKPPFRKMVNPARRVKVTKSGNPIPDLNSEEHLVTLAQREDALVDEVKQKLPDFVARCESSAEVIVIHLDAFAADYQEEELRLLGMAIKYAGLNGKEVQFIGSDRETL